MLLSALLAQLDIFQRLTAKDALSVHQVLLNSTKLLVRNVLQEPSPLEEELQAVAPLVKQEKWPLILEHKDVIIVALELFIRMQLSARNALLAHLEMGEFVANVILGVSQV